MEGMGIYMQYIIIEEGLMRCLPYFLIDIYIYSPGIWALKKIQDFSHALFLGQNAWDLHP